MNIEKLEVKNFLSKENQYHRRPYHLRSMILDFNNMSVENYILYNYAYNNDFRIDKRHTEYFIEISYLTLNKAFVESEKLKNYLIEILKNQILLNKNCCDLTPLKREIKVEKLRKKIKKIKLLCKF